MDVHEPDVDVQVHRAVEGVPRERHGVATFADVSSRWAPANRRAAVSTDPTQITTQIGTSSIPGTAVATTTSRQRSVLPSGPPLRRVPAAPAAASDANVGSVAAIAATRAQTTPELGTS